MLKYVPIEVSYVDHMGSDVNVANAARVSFAKIVEEWDASTNQIELKGVGRAPTSYTAKQNQKLLDYLAKHGHWSPFAHTCITVRCKVPLFLARQLVKHQVGANWNEESRRYIDGPVEFYLPNAVHTRPDSAKQGAGLEHPASTEIIDLLAMSTADAYRDYVRLLDYGVAPEEARMVLPLNSMTNFIWTGSLLFFQRVIEQRLDEHAQLAAQDFAKRLKEVVYPLYPNSYAALEKAYE